MIYPEHWIPGSLLNLTRYSDGSYRACLLGEDPKPDGSNCVEFDSSHAAQTFVSTWYAPAAIRDQVIQ